MSEIDSRARTVIPEHLMLSRLAQSEQMREFFIQMWLQNPALARQGGSKVQSLLSPLSASHNTHMGMTDNGQRGFSLISAIFLLVVIAALGTFAVSLSTTQQMSAAMDLLGSRAYQASRAGIEWGAYQVLQNTSGAFATACPGTTTANPAFPGTLADFNVTVACSGTPVSEGSATVTMYQITSTASGVAGATVGSQNYVERQMRVMIAR